MAVTKRHLSGKFQLHLKTSPTGYRESLIGTKEDSENVTVEIGGSKTGADSEEIKYGGEISFTTKDPKSLETDTKKSDGINIWFSKGKNEINDFNINGDKWTEI